MRPGLLSCAPDGASATRITKSPDLPIQEVCHVDTQAHVKAFALDSDVYSGAGSVGCPRAFGLAEGGFRDGDRGSCGSRCGRHG
ncbi:hypothetical protein SBA2_10074 [Acidobacteriia bacterium SbA2]|nr:hypothetical protein SBA2_10074 [Acidobacteriia bacterium SbA2]